MPVEQFAAIMGAGATRTRLNEVVDAVNTHAADASDPHGETLTQTNLTVTGALTLPADSIGDADVDWGTGSGQVNAADIPITDAGGLLTATDVEGALQEVAGALPPDGTFVLRTLASDPLDATPGNRPSGVINEPGVYSGGLYLCTDAGTPTWVKIGP